MVSRENWGGRVNFDRPDLSNRYAGVQGIAGVFPYFARELGGVMGCFLRLGLE